MGLATFLFALAVVFPFVSALPQARSTSGKRGLAYNSATLADLFTSSPEITWAYNWGLAPQGLSSKFEYVPMLHGDPTGNAGYIQAWKDGIKTAIAAGSKHIVAFNEPDLNGLSPAQAAKAYKRYMQPYAGKLKLGAPAVTNGQAPLGLTWLKHFLTECSSCTIDFVPIHWYCGYNLIEYFTDYMQEAYTDGGKRPLWLTEFQAQNVYCNTSATDQQQAEFLKTILPWLDGTSYIQRYSYFGAFESSSEGVFMVNQNGTGLTKSGKVFATLTKVNSTTPTSL